jgi:hypothetical protein
MTRPFLILAAIDASTGALGCLSLLRMAGDCSRAEELEQPAIG